MKTAIVLLCVLALAGCELKTKWRDITGHGRVPEQAQTDARECYESSGYASLNRNSTYADFEAFKVKLDTCMAGQGWEPIRDNC